MPLGRIEHDEPRLAEQPLRGLDDFLAVLERAGAVIGDPAPGRIDGAFEPDLAHELRYVPRERRNGRGLLGKLGISTEHEAIILDRGSAAGGVDHNRVEPAVLDLPRPGENVGARVTMRVLAQM